MAGVDSRMLDVKSLLKLEQYRGEREKFIGWKWQFYVAVRVINPELLTRLEFIEHHPGKEYKLSALD